MAVQTEGLHVAIIMDGNGRWAQDRHRPRLEGHRAGADTVRRIVTHAAESGLGTLSLYAFSTENWNRPPSEVKGLMLLLEDYIDSEVEKLHREGIRLVVSGRIGDLPDPPRAKLLDAMRYTENNRTMTLNLALSYGGRAEIIDATRELAQQVAAGELSPDDLTEELFASRLYNPQIPDIDLLIRTSGEQRISNFMLWRLAYAEMVFMNVQWPEFNERHLDDALAHFGGRSRRFGKTNGQLAL